MEWYGVVAILGVPVILLASFLIVAWQRINDLELDLSFVKDNQYRNWSGHQGRINDITQVLVKLRTDLSKVSQDQVNLHETICSRINELSEDFDMEIDHRLTYYEGSEKFTLWEVIGALIGNRKMVRPKVPLDKVFPKPKLVKKG